MAEPDAGPETVALFIAEIAMAKTILWNGPLAFLKFLILQRHVCDRPGARAIERNHNHRRWRFCNGGQTGRRCR